MKKKLLIATRNINKVKEIQQKLPEFKVLSLLDFPELPEIEETGKTFFENAKIKAKTIYNILKTPVLADDSGLEIKCLNGEPGVYSARYAGENSSQEQLISKVLKKMKNCDDRKANFTTVMVYINEKGKLFRSTGKVYGYVTKEPIGKNGFGYDPIFFYPPLKKTFAQLSREEKNKISHRARALEKILKKIHQDF